MYCIITHIYTHTHTHTHALQYFTEMGGAESNILSVVDDDYIGLAGDDIASLMIWRDSIHHALKVIRNSIDRYHIIYSIMHIYNDHDI